MVRQPRHGTRHRRCPRIRDFPYVRVTDRLIGVKAPPALPCQLFHMDAGLLAKYGGAVPRYTSYPTAPHFTAAVDPDVYTRWLGQLPATTPLSVYVHIPFC